MSIQYDKEIFSNNNHTIKVNFSGIKGDIVSPENLKMSLYAFNRIGQPKWTETLNFDQIKSLYEHLHQISIIKDSSSKISGKFIESTDEVSELINRLNENPDSNFLRAFLNKLNEDDRIASVFSSLSEHELDALFTLQKHKAWQIEIENLKILLELEEGEKIVEEIKKHTALNSYAAGQPEKIFQNWIEKNHLWIFGIEYIKKHDVRKIALYSEGDLLMESMDGFLDLIELKRPSHDIFGKIDTSHNSYYPSTDLSKVIGQCLYYMQKMDDVKLNLEKDYKVKIIRPRIKIIIGRTKDYTDEQYNALRMLNCSLNSIEIISYDSLIKYGEKMIAHYK